MFGRTRTAPEALSAATAPRSTASWPSAEPAAALEIPWHRGHRAFRCAYSRHAFRSETARCCDLTLLDHLPIVAGAHYVMDRGYMDFVRLYRLHQGGGFFVVRCKEPVSFRVLASPGNRAQSSYGRF